MDANIDWAELGAKVNSLPNTWMPRREQPEWDRMFTGMAEIQVSFQGRTDKARQWSVEAVAFSEILKGGFRDADGPQDDTALLAFGKEMRAVVAKGKNQFDA